MSRKSADANVATIGILQLHSNPLKSRIFLQYFQ